MPTFRVDSQTDVSFKPPCRVATDVSGSITLSGLQTIDGVTLVAGDRVLVRDQGDQTLNGIYVASSTAWQRAEDFDGSRDVARGTAVRVHSGTLYSGWYELTASDPVVFGASAITFQRWVLVPG